jgi:hypothetical protein
MNCNNTNKIRLQLSAAKKYWGRQPETAWLSFEATHQLGTGRRHLALVVDAILSHI